MRSFDYGVGKLGGSKSYKRDEHKANGHSVICERVWSFVPRNVILIHLDVDLIDAAKCKHI